jgi:hypothetical protein
MQLHYPPALLSFPLLKPRDTKPGDKDCVTLVKIGGPVVKKKTYSVQYSMDIYSRAFLNQPLTPDPKFSHGTQVVDVHAANMTMY